MPYEPGKPWPLEDFLKQIHDGLIRQGYKQGSPAYREYLLTKKDPEALAEQKRRAELAFHELAEKECEHHRRLIRCRECPPDVVKAARERLRELGYESGLRRSRWF